jgi:hypothetical protein
MNALEAKLKEQLATAFRTYPDAMLSQNCFHTTPESLKEWVDDLFLYDYNLLAWVLPRIFAAFLEHPELSKSARNELGTVVRFLDVVKDPAIFPYEEDHWKGGLMNQSAELRFENYSAKSAEMIADWLEFVALSESNEYTKRERVSALRYWRQRAEGIHRT